jgi:hypothetical protein
MAARVRRLLLPLALGVLILPAAASAQAQHRATFPDPYHREYRTATRHDPAPAAHAPAWGSWADAPGAWWNQQAPQPQADGYGQDGGPVSGRRGRPDPNLRMAVVPGDTDPRFANDAGMRDGWSGWGDGRTPDDRARHGWRAGWHGAAPGWGGVWWYGWGGDWPAYAADAGDGWSDGGWSGARGWGGAGWGSGSGSRSGWHGTFGIERGWGGGSRVIAMPAPRGE